MYNISEALDIQEQAASCCVTFCCVISCHLCFGPKVATEHTAKTIVDCQVEYTFCVGGNSPRQQVEVVCIHH